MTPERAKHIINSMRLHFLTDNYNYFKYKGVTKELALKSDDKWINGLVSRLMTEENLEKFLVANVMDYYQTNGKPPSYYKSFYNSGAFDTYKRWNNKQENLIAIVEKEIDRPIKELIILDNSHPLLYSRYIKDEVSIETICAVATAIPKLFKYWEQKTDDPILLPEFIKLCRKYYNFLDIDGEKVKKILTK